jgi:monoamine oxidase
MQITGAETDGFPDEAGSPTPPPRETDVIVIGGGLAGLAAAVTCSKAGVRVCLLESAGRVGGRVLTLRDPFDDGLSAEAGGEFVDGAHAVLHQFLAAYRLPLLPIPNGRRLFLLDGTVLRGESLTDFDPAAAADEQRLQAGSARLRARITDPRRPWLDAPDLDDRSVGEWLDGLHLSRMVRIHQQLWRTVDYGAPPEHLSLLQCARDEVLWQHAPDVPSGRVRGGMDRLPQAMAAELGARVVLNAAARTISQDAAGVTVAVQQGGVATTVRAAYAVLAVPPPARAGLALDPPLHGPQRAALLNLPMTRVTKLLLQVRRRFWEDHDSNGGSFTDGVVQATYETTAGQPGERAILTVYTADAVAGHLAALSEAERRAACLADLERLYPGCTQDIERVVTVAWDAAGPRGGAYSHFQPGQMRQFGPWLAQPFGRLHLAGEHTDQWQATMNGALASGARAGQEILDRLA